MSTDYKRPTAAHQCKRPIKITYLVDFFRTVHAGTEKQLAFLLTHLPRSGYDIQLISLQDSSFLRSEARSVFPDISIVSLGARADISKSLKTIPRLFRELRKARPDIVHAFFPASNGLGVILAKAAGVRTVIGSRRDMGFNLTWKDLAAMRIADRLVACIVSNSDAVRKKAICLEKVPASKIRLIYNGINLNGGYRKRVFPVEKAPVIGIVANLNRSVKRVDLFIKAAARVNRRYPEATFWIFGDGELRRDLEKLAADLKVKNSVVFWGRQGNVRRYMNEMDIGVICSDSEGFSNAIMEYMEAGLPVIATDTGGNPELVRHGVTGLLVAPNDEESLADAMINLIADPGRISGLGYAGRKAVENGYAVADMVEKTRQLYWCCSQNH
jgi:glycosyltransferase involved in cell wall biosynthesis